MRMPHWMRGLLAALVTALAVASCDHGSRGEPEQLTGPEESLFFSRDRVVRARDADGDVEEYTLVRESGLGSLTELRVSELIGIEGGQLTLLGHTLTVPAGAVTEPTIFSLTALPTGYVQVDLLAVRLEFGQLLNVGASGFDRPVRVELTYERATNVGADDEDDLVILRLDPEGLWAVHEVMPSEVDRQERTVSTWLDHFSGYCMAM